MNNMTLISPLCSEAISGSKDKRPNVLTKDAPFAVNTQEIPRIWGPMTQELWIEGQQILQITLYHMLSVKMSKPFFFV